MIQKELFLSSLLTKKALLFFLLAAMCLVFLHSSSAFAAGTADASLPWDTPIQKITTSIKGPIAYALGIGGLIAAAAMILFGHQIGDTLRMLINVVIGAAIIMGGATILDKLIPNSSGAVIACDTSNATPKAAVQ